MSVLLKPLRQYKWLLTEEQREQVDKWVNDMCTSVGARSGAIMDKPGDSTGAVGGMAIVPSSSFSKAAKAASCAAAVDKKSKAEMASDEKAKNKHAVMSKFFQPKGKFASAPKARGCTCFIGKIGG
jgi:hypothetical protein